jgi:GntR family transcriptional repressor for pyruvate dehydrogenase complex
MPDGSREQALLGNRRGVRTSKVFEPVKNEKLYKMVVSQVRSLIADGRLSPGDRLPPERELARLLSVSRASLRQAISAMEVLGVLERRQGDGTFVATGDDRVDVIASFSEHLLSRQLTPIEILEARIITECPVVRMCTERAADAEIEAIGARLERHRLMLGDATCLAEMNRDFHLAIAEGAHSRCLTRLTQGLYVMMQNNLWPTLKIMAEQDQQRTDRHLDQHEEIFRFIGSRRSAEAEEAMRQHLLTIEQEFHEDAQEVAEERNRA